LHALSIKADKVIYDAIGVGACVGSNLNGMYPTVRHEKFFAGGAVVYPDTYYGDTQIKNKDMFANIKAQAWWSVADRLKNTYNGVKRGQEFDVRDMIFIDGNIEYLDKLMTELATPRRTFDRAGRVLVESKIDMKKRGVMSPNIADAFIMAFLSVSPKPIQTPVFRGI
jgi:phage terminase large subunit